MKDILQEASQKTLGSSLSLIKIGIKEKEQYRIFLKELTEIILQHSLNPDAVIKNSYSPIQEALLQLEEETIKREPPEKNDKKILVAVPAERRQKVLQALVPNYVAPEQEKSLSQLLISSRTSEIICFKGNNRQLGESFQRLALLNLHFEHLDDDQIQSLTEKLGVDYSKIFRSRFKPVFANTLYHVNLFEKLEERGLIIRFKQLEKADELKVFANY